MIGENGNNILPGVNLEVLDNKTEGSLESRQIHLEF